MKLGLLIDLDTCVGCHACATACKEWNGASAISGPLADYDPYGAEPSGVWLNLGHGSSGWALSCGSARVLADMMGGRDPGIDLEGLGIERLLQH